MDSISRRDFFTKAFTGVVIAGTGGKVLGQLVPRIIETESPDTIQVEFTIDLMLPEFADLTTEYSSISINDTGVTSAPIIVMRVPNEKFVALVDQCTHEGFLFGKCDMTTKLFTCSNHGSQFDENGICKRGPGGGPATLPRLESIPIVYDKANSKLYLNRVVRVDEISYDGFSIQCYPNPAVAETVFEFALEKAGMTSLEIFDMRGLLVATIFSEMRSVGVQQALFNASPLASGKYNYRLRSSDGFEITRMLTVTR